MRKPSEYVAAAKARLRDSLIPDCAETMRHGERSATVTRIASPSIGDDPISGDDFAERVRVLAFVADFPMLRKGEAVMLGQTLHVVTSCKEDIAKAGYVVGLSDRLRPAAYSFTHRVDGTLRTKSFPVMVLVDDSGGTVDDVTTSAQGKMHKVLLVQDEWPEATPPHAGAAVTLYDGTRLAVQKVERRLPNGYIILATDDTTAPRR